MGKISKYFALTNASLIFAIFLLICKMSNPTSLVNAQFSCDDNCGGCPSGYTCSQTNCMCFSFPPPEEECDGWQCEWKWSAAKQKWVYKCTQCGGGGGGGPTCNTTPASSIDLDPLTSTSTQLDWIPGSNGTKQLLRIGANKSEVDAGCPGTASPTCVVKEDNLSASQNSYTTGNVLIPGTVYYARIITYKDVSCFSNSATLNYLSSCTVSPTATTIQLGGSSQTLTTSVNSSAEITQVTYSSSSPGIATVSTPDTTYQYTTSVSPTGIGSSTITSDVYFGSTLACSGTSTVTVVNPDPWWQVKDADVSANGNLTSNVPSGSYFGLAGAGGYPGVPSYSGTTDLTSSNVSTNGWIAQSSSSSSKVFNYDFFANQIPDSVVLNVLNSDGSAQSNTVSPDGYIWYKYTGVGGVDLTIPTANLGSSKVILLVEDADLIINGNMNLTDGSGFFGAFVNGSITVNPSVTSLEGIYLADSSFSTGVASSQLLVRGMVSAYGGISLQRDLDSGNQTTPAELFEYAPDQILLFPSKIGYRKINWKEVAP